MITNITLKNFKSHQHTILDLDESRLHAIVGQNSSGKTSVLQAIDYLNELDSQDFETVFQGNRSIDYIKSSGQNSLEITVEGWEYRTSRHTWTASFSWHPSRPRYYREVDEKLIVNKPLATPELRTGNRKDNSLLTLRDIPRSINHTVYLKLDDNKLSQAAYSDEVIPTIGADGAGLAPTLDYLRNESPELFTDLQIMLRQVIPSVQKVEVRRAKVEVLRERTIEVDGKTLPYEERREMTGQEVVLSMSSGERIPAHAISEGTMLTLGLLTVLFTPQKLNLLLLDDIEQGLHPHAQRKLVTVLKQIIAQNPDLQILFTTHSPYVLDELEASQVHILHSTANGYTVTNRLDEHPDAAWAKQTLTTGEFWDAEGEAWVAEEQIGE